MAEGWKSACAAAVASALALSCSSDGSSSSEGADGGAGAASSTGGAGGASGAGGSSAGSGGGNSSGGAAGAGGAGTGGTQASGGTGGLTGTDGGTCATGCTSDCVQGCFDVGDCTASGGGRLDLTPNVVTAGVVLSLAGAPETGELYYRAKGAATWWKGQPLVRIPDGRLAGSAFGLTGSTEYEIRVQAGTAVACGSTTTQPETPTSTVTGDLWVDSAASAGGDGSSGAPFRTIAEGVAAAGPGTDVHVRAGVYAESVTIAKSGSAGSYLRVTGEPGAVLDGSDAGAANGLSWQDETSGVWSTAWTGDPRYVSRDGARLYHYLSLADLRAGVGKNAVPIAEGFFVEAGRLTVRSADAPASHTFQIPVLNTAIQLSGAASVWIEGLEIRFYGEGDYGKGIDVTDASSDVVLRKNHVHDVPTGIWVRKGSSGVRVEDNEIHQSSVFSWAWDAVKATDHENDAISLAGGRGAIVARNLVHDVFNGVYAGSFTDDRNPDLAFDVDVHDNRLTRIGDDGFEPEGACVNARFWGNAADYLHNGVSLAPITYGPTWVVRNRFSNFQESGFKVSNDTSGRVWLFHNTCFTDDPQQNGMNVSGPFENIVFRNNVIRGTSYSIESTVVVSTDDLDYDGLYTTRGAPRIKWNDVRYDDLAALCAATGLECHGVGDDPLLVNPGAFQFAPGAGSPLVDAALRLYGINDVFAGAGPDIGYVEQGSSEPPAP